MGTPPARYAGGALELLNALIFFHGADRRRQGALPPCPLVTHLSDAALRIIMRDSLRTLRRPDATPDECTEARRRYDAAEAELIRRGGRLP